MDGGDDVKQCRAESDRQENVDLIPPALHVGGSWIVGVRGGGGAMGYGK